MTDRPVDDAPVYPGVEDTPGPTSNLKPEGPRDPATVHGAGHIYRAVPPPQPNGPLTPAEVEEIVKFAQGAIPDIETSLVGRLLAQEARTAHELDRTVKAALEKHADLEALRLSSRKVEADLRQALATACKERDELLAAAERRKKRDAKKRKIAADVEQLKRTIAATPRRRRH